MSGSIQNSRHISLIDLLCGPRIVSRITIHKPTYPVVQRQRVAGAAGDGHDSDTAVDAAWEEQARRLGHEVDAADFEGGGAFFGNGRGRGRWMGCAWDWLDVSLEGVVR